MRIIGLDVGCGSAVLCCLDEFPANILQHYKVLRKQKQFYKVLCDRLGADKLLSLQPNGIVLEPSGHWYSQFWVTLAKHHGIAIYWVSHTDLYCARGEYGFKNKRDTEDALSLAATYFDSSFINDQGQKRYLNYYQNELVVNLRELFLAKEQLQKLRTNLIAQLRQRLSYELPEIATSAMKISEVKGYTPLIYWLATDRANTRYDKIHSSSIGQELNIKISNYTRNHARLIYDIELRYFNYLELLKDAISNSNFDAYNRVFDRFNFGISVRALLLFNIYPFEKFLFQGKPLIEREYNDNDRLQKRDRSLRKFQAFLGMSYSFSDSGKKSMKKFHGSSMIRSHLYAWAVCMVAPSSNRISSDVGRQLSDRYQELRKTVKGKDALIRILFKATRLLYCELVKELVR
ncbi:IS110 family transposase [Pleurocapsa sp. FMAR1]|uniref:IS110 family transposase n=1 Tax=Pleurocapsa sp. FMAR1 TaxID=3040204 RepID=UPI0029C6E3C8|nr:transposase [Pleurocapsa sp. FMAR1]